MIVKGQALEQMLRRPAATLRAVLFYGPNAGRIQEYARRAVRAIVEDISDPFRVAYLTAADLKEDPARLADEAAALTFTGGRRVVRVRGAGDALTEAFVNCLDFVSGDSLIVAEAGELARTSKLRKLFETSPVCAIAACYEESDADMEALVIGHLRQYGLSITSEAKDYLLHCLGEDRLVTRQELDKLILYKGPRSILPNWAGDGGDGVRDTRDIRDTGGIRDTRDTGDIRDGLVVTGSSDIKEAMDTHNVHDAADIRDSYDIPDTVDISDTTDTADVRDAMDIRDTVGVRDTIDTRGIRDIMGIIDTRNTIDTHDTAGIRDSFAMRDGRASGTPDNMQIELADVMACIGDSASSDLDSIYDAIALGDSVGLDRQIQRAYDSAISTIAILRFVSNHLMRAQMAMASIDAGASIDVALRNLRPPVHFSRTPLFRQQLRLWDSIRIARALDLLLEAEIACKTTGAPDLSLCRRALLQVAFLARRNA